MNYTDIAVTVRSAQISNQEFIMSSAETQSIPSIPSIPIIEVDADQLYMEQTGELPRTLSWALSTDSIFIDGILKRLMASMRSAVYRGNVSFVLEWDHDTKATRPVEYGIEAFCQGDLTVWSDGGEHSPRPWRLSARVEARMDDYGVGGFHAVPDTPGEAIVASRHTLEVTKFVGQSVANMIVGLLPGLLAREHIEDLLELPRSRMPLPGDVREWEELSQDWKCKVRPPVAGPDQYAKAEEISKMINDEITDHRNVILSLIEDILGISGTYDLKPGDKSVIRCDKDIYTLDAARLANILTLCGYPIYTDENGLSIPPKSKDFSSKLYMLMDLIKQYPWVNLTPNLNTMASVIEVPLSALVRAGLDDCLDAVRAYEKTIRDHLKNLMDQLTAGLLDGPVGQIQGTYDWHDDSELPSASTIASARDAIISTGWLAEVHSVDQEGLHPWGLYAVPSDGWDHGMRRVLKWLTGSLGDTLKVLVMPVPEP